MQKELRNTFFEWLLEDKEGYLCIARADEANPRKTFKERFFHWPTQKDDLFAFLDREARSKNLWFGVNILDHGKRTKQHCIPDNLVWADLDTANPDTITPKPNLVIRSSPNRYQAIWKMDQTIPTDVAEDYSRRIAYKYKQDGADISGWDLTQLLRVPFTTNFKYPDHPIVEVLPGVSDAFTMIEEMESIEIAPVPEMDESGEGDMPEITTLPDSETIIYKYQNWLDNSFFELHTIEPEHSDDWSTRLWKLINLGFEAGMESDEVFAIAISARCNKYVRDNRPLRFLWREVLKAKIVQARIGDVSANWEPIVMPNILLEDDEYSETFIDQYRSWAANATDAVEDFHELCAAVIMSTLLANSLKLETDYGTIVPNLWGMILGDSTLSRKTTAMEMAKDFIYQVDPDTLVSTDGSAEGLIQALSMRPNQVSMFHKDEVAGFFKSINRKDYLSGMMETLTELYDVKNARRTLRKEVIELRKPIFIFFAGGIRDEVYGHLSDENVTGGFLPRFLVVIGEQDLARIRPTGPKTAEGTKQKETLLNHLRETHEAYVMKPQGSVKIGDQIISLADVDEFETIEVILSDGAWERYRYTESAMVEIADKSYYRHLALPTFERLSRSMLKLAILLAATRQKPTDNSIIVERTDVCNAARYIQKWGRHSVELMLNAGKGANLRTMEKVRKTIQTKPGIFKSEIMRMYHYNSREMQDIIQTLVDRGEITRKSKGKAEQLWTIV